MLYWDIWGWFQCSVEYKIIIIPGVDKNNLFLLWHGWGFCLYVSAFASFSNLSFDYLYVWSLNCPLKTTTSTANTRSEQAHIPTCNIFPYNNLHHMSKETGDIVVRLLVLLLLFYLLWHSTCLPQLKHLADALAEHCWYLLGASWTGQNPPTY